MHDFVELLRAIAWPATVLIVVFLLRGQIKAFVSKLSDSIGQAAQISIGRKGLEIKLNNKIAAVSSRIEALSAAQGQVTETVYKTDRRRRRGQTPVEPAADIPQSLRDLAAAYLAVKEPDWWKRVLSKNDLALQMGDLVIREDVPRDLLVQERDEALHLALAAAVVAVPERGDLERILSVAPTTARLHVRYKLIVALTSLINKGLVRRTDIATVGNALQQMGMGADQSLERLISDARSLLDALSLGELTISG